MLLEAPTFDWSISFGNILSVLTIVAGILIAWVKLNEAARVNARDLMALAKEFADHEAEAKARDKIIYEQHALQQTQAEILKNLERRITLAEDREERFSQQMKADQQGFLNCMRELIDRVTNWQNRDR